MSLFDGSATRMHCNRSFNYPDKLSGYSIQQFLIDFSSSCSFLALYGCDPLYHNSKQIPKDQQSTSMPYGRLSTISGAMNTGVPQAFDFLASLLGSLVEKPKSHNFFTALAISVYKEPVAHQDVGGLQVAVDNQPLMQILKSQCNLIAHQSQGALWQLLAKELGRLPIPTVLHQDVMVFAVLNVPVELDDMWMIQF